LAGISGRFVIASIGGLQAKSRQSRRPGEVHLRRS
jgi:hypothetical protein